MTDRRGGSSSEKKQYQKNYTNKRVTNKNNNSFFSNSFQQKKMWKKSQIEKDHVVRDTEVFRMLMLQFLHVLLLLLHLLASVGILLPIDTVACFFVVGDVARNSNKGLESLNENISNPRFKMKWDQLKPNKNMQVENTHAEM